jgi:hypothetical protein
MAFNGIPTGTTFSALSAGQAKKACPTRRYRRHPNFLFDLRSLLPYSDDAVIKTEPDLKNQG